MNRHPVAFVGAKEIHEAFQSMDDSWDMQIPLESVTDLEEELAADPSYAKISPNTSLIIFFSREYRKNPEKFAQLAAYTAPYSVVCILIPNSDRNEEHEIRAHIMEHQKMFAESVDNPDYNERVPFFFVSYENPQAEIYESIYQFTRSDAISDDVKRDVATMLPEGQVPEIDVILEEDDDEEEIIIPEKEPGDTSKVITVTSSKGGSGKSTVAMLIAAYIKKSSDQAAASGQISEPLKVCVVDLDVRDGQLGFLNGSLKPTVIDILAEGEPNVTNVKKGIFHNQRTGVDFVFAAKRPRSSREIPTSFYVQLITTLRVLYDVVVLDTSVNYLDPLLEKVAYPMSDEIVLVTDFSISSIFGMSRWISETTESSVDAGDMDPIPKSKVKVVLNKSLKDVNMEIDRIEKSAKGVPVIAAYPSSPSLVTFCSNTCATEQILNERIFNEITLDVVTELLPNAILPPIPYMK